MERKWSGKTQGGTFGQKSVLFYFKYGSLRLIYLILYIVIPFYLIFDKKGVRVTKWYALNVVGINPEKLRKFLFRVYYNFGQVFLDRFAILGNPKNKFNFTIENDSAFQQLLNQEKGFLIVSAHVGNFELLSYSMGKINKTLRPILFGGEAEVFKQMRNTVFKDKNIDPIILDETGSYIFDINCALMNGNIVSMPADRIMGNMKHFTTDFLGHQASFPLGVFQIAATLNVPIVAIFVVKTSTKNFKVLVNPINFTDENQSNPVKAKLLGQQYVKHLETIVQKYPTQWYNFYPFWEEQA